MPSADRQGVYGVGQTDTFHKKKSAITKVLNEKESRRKGRTRQEGRERRKGKAEKSGFTHLLHSAFTK